MIIYKHTRWRSILVNSSLLKACLKIRIKANRWSFLCLLFTPSLGWVLEEWDCGLAATACGSRPTLPLRPYSCGRMVGRQFCDAHIGYGLRIKPISRCGNNESAVDRCSLPWVVMADRGSYRRRLATETGNISFWNHNCKRGLDNGSGLLRKTPRLRKLTHQAQCGLQCGLKGNQVTDMATYRRRL